MFELREKLASAERTAEEKTQENLRLLSNLQNRVLEKTKVGLSREDHNYFLG